jgi:hypothetical protein
VPTVPETGSVGEPLLASHANAFPVSSLPPMIGERTTQHVGSLDAATSTTGFRIAENESPQPLDRVFATFGYDSNVREGSLHLAGYGQADIWRTSVGFEKTLLDGDASLGMRLPLVTLGVDAGIGLADSTNTSVGDLDVIFKYLVYDDPASGKVLSAGLVVTIPTGPDSFGRVTPPASYPGPHATLLQPFVGYICVRGDAYLQGFTSIVVPTDVNEPTLLFKDMGVGYFVHRRAEDVLLTAIVPTLELHVNTPVNHRDHPLEDALDLTEGVHFGLRHRGWVTVGIGENLTGPKTCDL